MEVIRTVVIRVDIWNIQHPDNGSIKLPVCYWIYKADKLYPYKLVFLLLYLLSLAEF